MIRTCSLFSLLVLATSATHAQTIIQGPVLHPTTKSRFYVVQAADWNQARTFARSRGGDLVTIDSPEKNEWIRANLTANNTRKVFIGLNDADAEGTFRWSSGSTSAFRNWAPGEPFNSNNNDFALMFGPTGTWQLTNTSYSPFAVMEVSGPLKVPQEFQTIDAAFDYASDVGGMIIDISPGTYTLASSLSAADQNTVRGVGPVAPTIRSAPGRAFFAVFGRWTFENIAFVDRSQSYGVITLNSSAGSMTFRDCTFTSELGRSSLPILSSFIGPVRVERCTFNTVSAAAAALVNEGGNFQFVNCVFNNVATITAQGSGSAFTATNCTFHRVGDGTQVFAPGWTAAVNNAVFSNVSGQVNRNGISINHSIVPFEIPLTTGNIAAFPQYVNAAAGDFRLRPGTVGVDAGNAAAFLSAGATAPVDHAGALRFVDDPTTTNSPAASSFAIDMGAFEGQPCSADFNNNGIVDFFDYLDFVQAFDGGC